ncbi:hypothetical protein N656DRAFT_707388 [Canariomyces notabilis]|uniref:Uncharacterized protein n=1 Tax=Canariomyces notabilis TaxID=2074819 RepID=A0AAN6TFG3_9PEZI|nr:hypothetical protein N656DRAFT_707388 [Canariomyces arenarius]
MLVKRVIPALAAIGSAAAQSRTCTVSTTTIHSQADATGLSGCRTVSGSIVLAEDAAGAISLSGPEEITGDLQILNNGALETLQSSSLETIGGEFKMNNVTKLISLDFSELESVGSLSWTSVTNLQTATFGPLTKADQVIISDTFLNTLEGIDLSTVRLLDINNNRLLSTFTSKLGSLSENLNIQANGLSLNVSLPNLIWIANMTIANVTDFQVPSLEIVNGSARFDSNYFSTFSAPNLTETSSGDISFVGNSNLDNLTFPVLTKIGGGLLIANNTALEKMTAFPELESVGGAVKLRGSFKEVAFPKLDIVEGAFDVASTEDINSSCDTLGKLAPSSQGGEGKVKGTYACTSKVADANDDTSSGGSSSGGSGSDSSDGGNNDNGAAGLVLNTALFGLVAVAAVASAL